MGRQVFTAGEILTAANMNDLSDQTVMVFDDDDARATAIPTPSEGMTTYLKDLDAVEFFDGSVFRRVGGLIAVKEAKRTTPVTSGSVASGANFAVTDLSITHTLADASNRLIITAFFGNAASTSTFANVGIGVADDGTLINIADSPGDRVAVTSGGRQTRSSPDDFGLNEIISMPSIAFVHAPNDTASHTYTVRAININLTSQTIFINRSQVDTNTARFPRAVSGITIQEVAV